MLLLCNAGGSNNARHYYLFKQDIQQLANTIGLGIRIAHIRHTPQNTIRLNIVCFPI